MKIPEPDKYRVYCNSMLPGLKLFLLFCALTALFLMPAGNAVAQEADSVKKDVYVLKGKVTDAESGEEIPFANVIVKHESKQVGSAASDFDGFYEINIIDESIIDGNFEIEAFYVSYKKKMISGVHIHPANIRYLNISLESTSHAERRSDEIEIYRLPFFYEILDVPGTRTYTREDFKNRFR